MSPERLKGEAHQMSSDCWSLGLIVIECAFGRHPWVGTDGQAPNVFHLMQQIAGSDPCADLENLNYSADFNDFCRKCLARDPSQRPSSTKLLEHPWIRESRNDQNTNLTKWLSLRMGF